MNSYRSRRILHSLLNSAFCFDFSVHNSRSFSVTACVFEKFRNPLRRKEFGRFRNNDEREITRICATVLGNGALGQPRCVGLFTDHKGILFNCGEGVGRILREYEGVFHEIRHVFVTKREWCNLSGLADIHLTHESYGVKWLNLFGPTGIEHFKYLITGETVSTKLIKRSTPYFDDAFEIRSISINADQRSKTIKKSFNDAEDVVFSYVCKILKQPGELVPEKLIEHKVPIGPHLLQLKNDEDVVLPSGRIIRSCDVINLSNKEEFLLIVDCPSEDFLLPFVTKGEFARYQFPSDEASKVATVFHFSPPHIMKTKFYQNWMKGFHAETQHVVLNTSCPFICSKAVYQNQSIFHILHQDIFKLLPNPKVENEDYGIDNLIHAPPMLQIHYRPKKELDWNNVVEYTPENFIEESKYFSNFIEEVNNLKSSITNSKLDSSCADVNEYPEVIFFGTSSSTSTAYRNVTAILINISDTKSILLDCGEGTFMQLVRYFGPEKIDSELRKISCVFISHLHTDHYLGLFQIIKARIEAFQNSGQRYIPLPLILPHEIFNVFKQYCMIFEPISSKVRVFPCKSFHDGAKLEKIQQLIGNIELKTFFVKHCHDSHGIVVKKGSEWKIVYSGDSAPCQKIIDAGENCTLLIHEASIEDGFLNEAMARKHSTPSQVLDLAEKMNAKHTIMTHFSKRYLAVPVFEDTHNKNVGCAFDFMKVQLHQLPLIPLFLPAMKCLFQEQLASHAERTSFVINFENSFIKTYKRITNSEYS